MPGQFLQLAVKGISLYKMSLKMCINPSKLKLTPDSNLLELSTIIKINKRINMWETKYFCIINKIVYNK